MKMSKVWLKTLVLLFITVAFLTTGCCKKKKPLEMQPAEKQTTQGISEDELAAKRQAEEMARMKAAAKQRFVNEDVHFDFDSSALTPDAQEILKEKVAYMNANPEITVTIEGNCDERGTEAYNMALGERRAQSIKNFMVNAGVAASRMQTVSFGEEKPIDPAHNEAAWAKNRRGHFVIN